VGDSTMKRVVVMRLLGIRLGAELVRKVEAAEEEDKATAQTKAAKEDLDETPLTRLDIKHTVATVRDKPTV